MTHATKRELHLRTKHIEPRKNKQKELTYLNEKINYLELDDKKENRKVKRL